jgi:hypothetical protein
MIIKFPVLSLAILLQLGCCLPQVSSDWNEKSRKLQETRSETTGWIDVDVGSKHACAVHSDKTFKCWGEEALDLGVDSGIQDIGVGIQHACFLHTSGMVECVGRDYNGSATPPPGQFSMIDTAYTASCGIESGTGTVQCWGWVSSYGQDETAPAGSFVSVSVATGFACALDGAGAVSCWGCASDPNSQGECNPPATPFSQISVGSLTPCGVRTDGYIECWGLLAGTTNERFLAVSRGNYLTCGITTENLVRCWNYDIKDTWSPLEDDIKFDMIDATNKGFCGIAVDGSILCWGEKRDSALSIIDE